LSSTPPHPLSNMDPVSSVAVPGTHPHSPTTQPYYEELLLFQQLYNQPSRPGVNYGWQIPNKMPVPSDLTGSSSANEQNRAPLIHRTDSTSSSQPSMKDNHALSIALPRSDVRSPAPEPNEEHPEPKTEFHSSFASADKHELPTLRRQSVTVEERGNNWIDGRRSASQVDRTESDRPSYSTPASTNNLHR
jgi:hypothetical protein